MRSASTPQRHLRYYRPLHEDSLYLYDALFNRIDKISQSLDQKGFVEPMKTPGTTLLSSSSVRHVSAHSNVIRAYPLNELADELDAALPGSWGEPVTVRPTTITKLGGELNGAVLALGYHHETVEAEMTALRSKLASLGQVAVDGYTRAHISVARFTFSPNLPPAVVQAAQTMVEGRSFTLGPVEATIYDPTNRDD